MIKQKFKPAVFLVVGMLTLQSCAAPPATPTVPAATATPAPPTATPVPLYKDAKAPVADRVADLLAQMTLEEKVGQMTQIDRGFLVSKDDIAKYYLGSLLSGGGSVPSPNTPAAWEDMYDGFQSIALSTRLGIPLIYGIDAVHGHNNVYGATIFPHNIGLGATRDPELVQKIGRMTAEEVAGTGLDWTFSPCICVARDERWGRTYESFGEDPALVQSMTTIIDGYQGSDLSAGDSILATAKHFAGDGGTTNGKDQGNTDATEADFRALFVTPYEAAVKRNVGSIMVSFSSWNGQKMHSNQHLITEVLKGELGFKGFVVSDWAAVKQLKGDYAAQVSTAINAGIDMVMVPDDYQTFTLVLKNEVNNGHIPMSRIDDAVSRILTKKFELALFEKPYADRTYAAQVGSAAHRDVARQAVRESLVLLKNENNLLPLAKDLDKVFVAGKNADDLGNQSGGWTLTWQGSSGKITQGTTILQGIKETVSADTTVTYDREADGLDTSYKVAIVVIGETPYAEGKGDKLLLELDAIDLNVLRKVKAVGVPTVVVLVSGRPLVVTDQLPDWAAFVAAWLPGTEGQGVADVLFGDYNPTGKLPHTWPRSIKQIPINVGDSDYDPLFPFGFGLSYP
jgi:beta-glucosidase